MSRSQPKIDRPQHDRSEWWVGFFTFGGFAVGYAWLLALLRKALIALLLVPSAAIAFGLACALVFNDGSIR